MLIVLFLVTSQLQAVDLGSEIGRQNRQLDRIKGQVRLAASDVCSYLREYIVDACWLCCRSLPPLSAQAL